MKQTIDRLEAILYQLPLFDEYRPDQKSGGLEELAEILNVKIEKEEPEQEDYVYEIAYKLSLYNWK